MICKKCGSRVRDDANFCTACGSPLSAAGEKLHVRRRNIRIGVVAGLVICGTLAMEWLVVFPALRRDEPAAKEETEVAETEFIDSVVLETQAIDIPEVVLPEVPAVELLDWSKVPDTAEKYFEYEAGTTENTVVLTNYTGKEKIVKVPETIQGKTVISASNRTFRGNGEITHVYLPDSFRFYGQEGVDNSSFFANCLSLQQVRLSDYDMPEYIFDGCKELYSVTYWEEAPEAAVVREGAFQRCHSLPTIELKESVTKIEAYAFMGCLSLRYAVIPGEAEIGDHAFGGCEKLEALSIPKVTAIGDQTFDRCVSLKLLVAPYLQKMDGNAFVGCSNLETAILPRLVRDNGAFPGCEKLSRLCISKYSENFNGNSLNDCSALKEIELVVPEPHKLAPNELFFEDGILYVRTAEGEVGVERVLESYEFDELVLPPDTAWLVGYPFLNVRFRSITLPASLKEMRGTVFCVCPTLESVSLEPGTKLEVVDEDLFYNCPNLKSVDFSNDQGSAEYEFYFRDCPVPEVLNYPKR